MAVDQARKDSVKTLAKKIKLAWSKLKDDSGCTDDEKASAKELIEKLLKKYDLSIDWKTGHVTDNKQAGQQASQPKQEQPKQEQPKTKTAGKTKQAGIWTTANLTDYINQQLGLTMTAKILRRYLRMMDRYNDNKMTHYSWTGPNDPLVKEVLEFIKTKKAS